MNKITAILILCTIILLSACTGRSTLENNNVNAPVTVEDDRTNILETATSRLPAATSPLTKREILPTTSFTVNDPENARNLPNERIEYSYGVAKNSQPHMNSVGAQNFFESKGYKAVCYDRKSAEKVLYLTFDCGWENGYTDKVLDVLKEKKVPAAFFCTLDHIKSSPELIARMINEGHTVGNHSANHPNFAEIDRQRMADEILECDNYLRRTYGYTSPFFRFPEGCYTENALELVGSMGFTSVFWSCAYADWDVNAAKGGDHAFNTVTARLHPGAIILLHSVSPDNAEALGRIIDFARENGYEFKALSDYKM